MNHLFSILGSFVYLIRKNLFVIWNIGFRMEPFVIGRNERVYREK